MDTDSTRTSVPSVTASTGTLCSKDEEYNPFEHRQVDKPNSDKGAFINLLKCSLGSGVLAMPFAFKNGGLIFGLFGTICLGIICSHCVQILIQCSHILCRRAKVPVLDYPKTAGLAFSTGPKKFRRFATAAEWAVKLILILTIAVCSVYVVLISSTIKQIVEHFEPSSSVDIRLYMVALFIPLLLLCFIPDLKYLVPFSGVATGCMVVVYGIILYYMFETIENPLDRNYIGTLQHIPLFFATASFSMEGIGIVMPIENTMKHPEHFISCPAIFFLVMIVVVVIDAFIGFFGYLRFGEQTEGSVTLNLLQHYPDDIPAQLAQYLIALAILLSYPLILFTPALTIWDDIKHKFPKNRYYLYSTILRICLTVFTVLFAIAVPDLGPIISLVGAICFSTVGLVFPVVLDIVTRWDETGFYHWRLWKNIILFAFSVLLLVAGIYSSILDII